MPFENLSLCPLFEFDGDPNVCIRHCEDCRYEIVPCIACGRPAIAHDLICVDCQAN